MKNLAHVTKEDAIEIIKAGYGSLMREGNWTLEDKTETLEEPCKLLQCRRKILLFWFNEDAINANYTEDAYENDGIKFDDSWFDVKLACYVKAFELGYDVPVISNSVMAKVLDPNVIVEKTDS